LTTAQAEILDRLYVSGIVREQERSTVQQAVDNLQETDPAAIAAALVSTGLLTPFQARELLEGRHRRLRIEQFVLKDILGVGGMGTVYDAIDARTGERVAVKVLSERFKHDSGMRARFQLEARTGMRARHENLIRTLQLGRTDDVFGEVDFVVMELCEGVALHELVGLNGPVGCAAACDVTRQTARGLAFLHKQGMVHRDVKPENLLIDHEGVARLHDYGLAYLGTEVCEDEFALSMVFGHDCLGTAEYMPPEQAEDSLAADARSDIYSLGGTMYVALTGRRPFQGRTRAELIEAHRSQPVQPPQTLNSSVPDKVAAIVLRMLAKSPDDRFQSMSEVIAALHPFARRAPVDFDFSRLLKLRARAAAKKAGSQLTPTQLRSSSAARTSGTMASQRPTQTPVETVIDEQRPRKRGSSGGPTRANTGSSATAAEELVEQASIGARRPLRCNARLVFPDGSDFRLIRSGYSLGRAPDNDLQFDAGDLSGHHCQLAFDGACWWITDRNSKNGIRVNGCPVQECALAPGDTVKLAGRVQFRIEYESPARHRPQRRIWKWLAAVLAAAATAGALWYLLW
jgi:serine/threonine-protein kinase